MSELITEGGWCAPAHYETYPYTDIDLPDLNLPEITVDRGGLRYPTAAEIEARQRELIEDAEAFAGWGWIGQVY